MSNEELSSVPAATLQQIKSRTLDKNLKELKTVLRAAVKLEMATIPIYLYTYYSVCRTPGQDTATAKPIPKDEYFPHESSLYGNVAGATIMSVAVEEMLHMSLAMNLLGSTLGHGETLPQIYDGLTFGNSGGIVLPALSTLKKKQKTSHKKNTHPVEEVTGEPLEIPLARLSMKQLHHFMRIEYPALEGSKAPTIDFDTPQWATIGEAYGFAEALIRYGDSGKPMPDSVFQQPNVYQIGSDNYSASNIDTLSSGDKSFNYKNPPPVGCPGSASKVAVFENDDAHDHEGPTALFRIHSNADAVRAIQTICEQGEGADYSQWVEDSKGNELEESHYYKFWTLTSYLPGYDPGNTAPPRVPGITPPTAQEPIEDLRERFVYKFPRNPKASYYSDNARPMVNLANALFQYMLIMSETTLLVPYSRQKLYFNKTMHQSMIWVMDKYYQALRNIKDRGHHIVPTFENPFPVGTTRETAFAEMQKIVAACKAKSVAINGVSAEVSYCFDRVANLPDVSVFWEGDTGVTPTTLPDYLTPPTLPKVTPDPARVGTTVPPKPYPVPEKSDPKYKDYEPYVGTEAFPSAPPTDAALDIAAGAGNWVRHACMGLNSCKNQGRTLANDCAGQGWCATSLEYNTAAPDQPSIVNHTCHVQNNCAGQGGCGLYGTEEELNHPGGNACQTLGSCATPINAERFITEGDNRTKSVWAQARSHFASTVWPTLEEGGKDKPLPAFPSGIDADKQALFKGGPTIQWMEGSNDGNGMTACGASGMSGAGSCA